MGNGEDKKDDQDGEDVVWVDTEMTSAAAVEPARFTIDTIARNFSVTPEALLRYEVLGIVNPTSYGKVQVFDQGDCERLALVLADRRMAGALEEIGRLLKGEKPQGSMQDFERGRESCMDQIIRLEKQRADISTILAQLRRVYTMLTLKAKPSEGPPK